MQYLEEISETYNKVDVLLLSLAENGADPANYVLGAQKRSAKNVTNGIWTVNGYRVASRGDEKLGLTSPQIKAAETNAREDSNNESKDKAPSDWHYRVVRDRPLLMVHVLSPTQNPDLEGLRVPAFGVSFPDGLFTTSIGIVANKIWVEQMYGPDNDDPDDEDDYDE